MSWTDAQFLEECDRGCRARKGAREIPLDIKSGAINTSSSESPQLLLILQQLSSTSEIIMPSDYSFLEETLLLMHFCPMCVQVAIAQDNLPTPPSSPAQSATSLSDSSMSDEDDVIHTSKDDDLAASRQDSSNGDDCNNSPSSLHEPILHQHRHPFVNGSAIVRNSTSQGDNITGQIWEEIAGPSKPGAIAIEQDGRPAIPSLTQPESSPAGGLLWSLSPVERGSSIIDGQYIALLPPSAEEMAYEPPEDDIDDPTAVQIDENFRFVHAPRVRMLPELTDEQPGGEEEDTSFEGQLCLRLTGLDVIVEDSD